MIKKCIPDDAMCLFPINEENIKVTIGMNQINTIEDEKNNRIIYVYNNEYKKINVDVVVQGGYWFVGPEYGETMDRDTIFYMFAPNKKSGKRNVTIKEKYSRERIENYD